MNHYGNTIEEKKEVIILMLVMVEQVETDGEIVYIVTYWVGIDTD